MPSAFENFFEDNLFKVCFDNNFANLNCILGSSEFIISLGILSYTIIGLITMLKYYDKFNFEISLLVFTVFQIILVDFIIITPHDFLYEVFFLIQLFIISLIIRKFLKITKKSKFRENLIFLIINAINIIIFTFYILSLLEVLFTNIYLYIRLTSRFFYFLTTVNLAVLCRSLIKKLEKYETNNESYDLYYKRSLSEHSNKSEHFVVSFYSTELFFMIRKKQIMPLYVLNLLCSFIQMIFLLFKNFILNEYFQKIEYKLISTNEGYIIYYIYLLTYFLNIMINFICFYWIIRDQYKEDDRRKKKKNKKFLDEDFIKRETIMSNQEEKKEEIFCNDSVKRKKFKKSLYSNTFTEEEDKDQEKYFVKGNKEGNDIIEEDSREQLDESTSERKTILSQNAINNSNNDFI